MNEIYPNSQGSRVVLDLLPDSHIDLGDTSGWAVQMQQQQGQVNSVIVEILKCASIQMFKCQNAQVQNKKARSKAQMIKYKKNRDM